MYDHRIVLNLVHRYGEACRREDHEQAGRLYSEIVRAVQDDEEAPRPSGMEDRGAVVFAEL